MLNLAEFFDQKSNSVSDRCSLKACMHYHQISLQTGALTARLSDHPQKVNGLAGITMGTIIQSIACLIAGAALGLAFLWKLALVGIGMSIIAFEILILH